MVKLDEQQSATKPVRSVAKPGKSAKVANEPQSQLRGRGLVYIDTDDDVTSIVGKIKNCKDAVVALVPPKRVGVLQSVVNLKLLQRAAKTAGKRLAIVTTDSALVNLASGLTIPVAKNINAQAKVPDMVDDDDVSDVIDGNDLAVGDLARMNDRKTPEDKDISAAVAAIETDDKINNDRDADGVNDDEQKPRTNTRKPKGMNKSKVPNVNDLRKKILIGGGIAVVLIGFLVWAVVFAPGATITIKAKTSSVDVAKGLVLTPSSDKDVDNGELSPVVKQKKQNESVEFDATGSKETGEKAKGTVAFCYENSKNDPDADEPTPNTISIPAGTRLYANGMQYTTDAAVEARGGWDSSSSRKCETYYSVSATAVNIGDAGNVSQNTQFTVSGFTNVSALAKTDFAGGSKRTIKVVQQSDVDAAVAKLQEQGDADAAKKELEGQMSKSTKIIDGSFSANQGNVKVSPSVGAEAAGKASVSVEITYTLVGVDNSDLGDVINAQIKDQIDSGKQKVYENGANDVKFSDFAATRNGYTVTIKTTAHVGPVINEDDVKKQVTGKKAEEIKATLKQTNGVSDVEVNMSPFWVSSAPAADKIKVNFTIDE